MDAGWLQVASVFTKREPKTPMAFYNRIAFVLGAMVIAACYANMDGHKWIFFSVISGLIVALVVWVSFFAWKKPAHLLSGEETHLERYKIEYMQGLGSGKGSTQPLGGVAEEVQR
jgi:amino acid permease